MFNQQLQPVTSINAQLNGSSDLFKTNINFILFIKPGEIAEMDINKQMRIHENWMSDLCRIIFLNFNTFSPKKQNWATQLCIVPKSR